MHPWTGDLLTVIEQQTMEFNETNLWGIKINTVSAGSIDNLFATVSAGLENDNFPHLVAGNSDHLQYWYKKYKMAIDLTSYINDNQWGITENGELLPKYLIQDQNDGSQIGIPALRDGQVLFYNQGWANDLGFQTPPETLEEFKAQVCAAAAANRNDEIAENDGTGGLIINNNSLVLVSWLFAHSTNPFPANPDDSYQINTPEASQALRYLRELYDKNCAWNSRLPEPYEYFATRHALFYSGTLQDISTQQQASNWLQSDDAWTVIPFPANNGEPIMLVSGQSYGIFETTPEEQLAAWIFLRWLLLPRHQMNIVQSSNTLPLSNNILKDISNSRDLSLQLSQTTKLSNCVEPIPALASWHLISPIFEDLSWQLYYNETVEASDITLYLQLTDTMIKEILEYEQ